MDRRLAPFALALMVGTPLVHADSRTSTDRRSVVVAAPLHDYRYRIAGKVRMLFFWSGRDDVGGARLTWRGGEHTTAALLAGSHPERAPKRLNQWIYLREDGSANSAEVFAVRSK